MKTLEQEARNGKTLIVHPAKNIFGLSVRLNNKGLTVPDSSIQEALNKFEEEYFVKMPNIGELNITKVINSYLEKGYSLNKVNLGTELCFKFNRDNGLYLSTLNIQADAWKAYITHLSHQPAFSRTLFLGKNEKYFRQAYLDMQENFELLE